jgi:hypothetical protein
MREADVRSGLHAKVLCEHRDAPDTLVIDELSLWYGAARVDVAVVNGRIHGFEIKSDLDTLERLPEQRRIYCMVLDRVTMVVGRKHLDGTLAAVPDWWGIKLVFAGPRKAVHFEDVRCPRMNPSIDPVALASLLWCEELTDILSAVGAARGVRGKSRDCLSRRVAETLSLTDLRAEVRRRLKARDGWRAAERQGQCGGSSPLTAKS